MPFYSYVGRDETFIDEDYVISTVVDGEVKGRGLVPRDFGAQPVGYANFLQPYREEIIPRHEWADRIEEIENTGGLLSEMVKKAGLKCKDQGNTNYCWANAPVHCVEVCRVIQNEPLIYLSPASVAAPIKNFRNEGGWGTEALEFLIDYGACPTSLWPDNSISRQYDNDESRTERSSHRVVEWWDLAPRRFDLLMTFLLRHRKPVAAGYNWWLHEVTLYEPVVLGSNVFGIRFRNSWGMEEGDQGFGILTEAKAIPDDAVAPRSIVPIAA